ncbi:MAG: pitrilysin family protein [Hyphomicrobiaceae bacterium]
MLAAAPAYAQHRATEFTLDNGLRLVVVPDHRAPVVTHMVWYKVGASDEPAGSSGIAHFLEHLMFKGTEKIPAAQFSKIVAKNGGQDNAFTSQDVTSYHQNVAKDRLPLVMEMEADRMTGLRLTEDDIRTERDVILEERRSRVDNDPSSILNEQMMAALYLNHPYGVPVIGWAHEVAKLSRQDAFDFYHRYYAPNNAIVVVSGDVEPDEVLSLAQETYGKVPAMAGAERTPRRTEPPPVVERRVVLEDDRVGQATFERDYLVPSYATAKPGEAEALEILAKIFGGGASSRLYRSVLVDKGTAAHIGAYYSGSGLDSGRISLYGVATEGIDLAKVEADVDAEIAGLLRDGVTADEVDRAKKALIAEYVYEADGQSSLARRYGWALATGATIKEVEDWPEAMRKVTVEAVNAAARAYLDKRRSVTGWLVPKKA